MSSGLMSAARFVKSTPRLLNAVTEPGASDASTPVFSVLLSIGRPSMIISGWLLPLIELTPRMVIDDEAPARRTARDLDAGHAPLKGVDEVLALRLGDLGAAHRLLRGAEGALLGASAEGGDHHLVEARDRLGEREVGARLGAGGDPHGLLGGDEADASRLERAGAGRRAQRILAGGVRHRADRRADDQDLRVGHRALGRGVDDTAAHDAGLGGLGAARAGRSAGLRGRRRGQADNEEGRTGRDDGDAGKGG